MMPEPDWKTIGGVAFYVLLGVAGDLLLSRGMRRMPPFTGFKASEILRFLAHIWTTPAVIGGVTCLALNFSMLLALLTWADISLVAPSRALSYLVLTLLARWWLGEEVSRRRWMGVWLVSAGVLLVLLSG